MVFSRKGSWGGMPFAIPEDLPDPGIEPESLAFPALAGRFFTTSTAWEAQGVGTAVLKSHTSGQ